MILLVASLVLNDGWVGYSGSPRVLGSHPTIRMVSERIDVTIHRWIAHVDCRFTFKNEGPATSVRIGFPDQGDNDLVGDETRSIYEHFRSYVDNKRVRTELLPKTVPGGSDIRVFQVKTVRFQRGQTRRIREVYDVDLGSNPIEWPIPPGAGIQEFNYVFHTGSTWKGAIGRSELNVRFAQDAQVGAAAVRLGDEVDTSQIEYSKRSSQRDLVQTKHWRSFVVKGRSIRLIRRNWKPKSEDDVRLLFGPHLRGKDFPLDK